MQAASYYAQAKNSEALADALYRLEDFEGLEQLTAALPEGSPLLLHLGERFQSVGLCQPAAAAYIKVTRSAVAVYSLLGCKCALMSALCQRLSNALAYLPPFSFCLPVANYVSV